MTTVFALVDCNNFYVSCERLFRPDLKNEPVVCLSNNDGCVIARSAESKLLDIKMGDPWFKIKDVAAHSNVIAFSSNYPLYQHISDRVMTVLKSFSSAVEVYSIDECFLELDADGVNLELLGQSVRTRVMEWVGVPVSVGFGRTKTQAKLANNLAKSTEERNGVFDLTSSSASQLTHIYSQLPVDSVWGIGGKHAEKFNRLGVNSVEALLQLDLNVIRKLFNVLVAKTVLELKGQSVIGLDYLPAPKKHIMSSRSFGKNVMLKSELAESIAYYVQTSSEKMREQQSVAGGISVFVMSNRFNFGEELYSQSITIPLPYPTDDSILLLNTAHAALNVIFKEGIEYAKAGVCLVDLRSLKERQAGLFDTSEMLAHRARRANLMKTIDAINRTWGRGTIGLGTCGIKNPRDWIAKADKKSPCYTGKWDQIPIVQA